MKRPPREVASKGGLLAFAQALTNVQGQGQGEGAAPPPQASAPPEAPPPAPPLPEPDLLAAFEGRVGKCLERIAAAARSPGMKGDPYRENFVALAAVVELMPDLVRAIERTRAPLSDDDLAAFLSRVEETTDKRLKRESSRWYRAFDRRTNLLLVVWGLSLCLASFLGGVAITVRLTAG